MTGRENDSWQDLGDEHDQPPLETQQLDLVEEEERLPWLESPEDDWDEPQDSANGKLAGFVLMGLVALAAIVGGIWWITNRGPDPDLVADGSVIEAPDQPYKEAPQDPGGKTFDGTGDSSFAVSEGQNRPPQLGGEAGAPVAPAPAPAVVPAQTAAPADAPTGAPAAASGGVGVQVGAFSSKATAEAGWTKLVGQAGAVLSGVPHRVIAGNADIGTVYRLQAVAPDAASAQALCGKLKAAGISCQVK